MQQHWWVKVSFGITEEQMTITVDLAAYRLPNLGGGFAVPPEPKNVFALENSSSNTPVSPAYCMSLTRTDSLL